MFQAPIKSGLTHNSAVVCPSRDLYGLGLRSFGGRVEARLAAALSDEGAAAMA